PRPDDRGSRRRGAHHARRRGLTRAPDRSTPGAGASPARTGAPTAAVPTPWRFHALHQTGVRLVLNAPSWCIRSRRGAEFSFTFKEISTGTVRALQGDIRTGLKAPDRTMSPSEESQMSPAEVLKLIKDKNIKFVDYRFTDTKGKEQHVTVPAAQVTAETFEEGKMFDGSSIAGWKGIQESDMILMPEAGSAVIDPFMEEPTLLLRCDVVEPSTMQGYERDPRSLAKRAEAYLKSTGIAD